MDGTNLQYVLHYRAQRLTPIPLHDVASGVCSCNDGAKCNSAGKHPRTKRETAINATQQDWQRWLEAWPDMNIGILTGKDTGVFAVDIDPRHGGAKSLAKLIESNSPLPATATATTGGNGTHFLFRIPGGMSIGNSAGEVASGIDIRGDGGLIVVEPSVTKGAYKWGKLPTRDDVALPPVWLGFAIAAQDNKPLPDSPTDKLGGRPAFAMPADSSVAEGKRNNFLASAAGWLQSQGVRGGELVTMLNAVNVAKCSPPVGASEIDRIVASISKYDIALPANDSWPEPLDIKPSLPPVATFDYRLLPPVFRAWVQDIAERMQCPPDFLAVGALVAAGAVVGNRIGVQPKQMDTGWIEVPNLWGAVVGRPGVMKSPALAEVVAPLKALEKAALTSHAAATAQYNIDKMVYDVTKKKISEAIHKGATVSASQMPTEPEPPQPKRFLVNDATYQKLGAVLQGNPHGLLVYQDELAGVLMRLDAEGQESSRAFYLQAWDGKQPYTFDRIERGTVGTPHLCFSLLGGIQPGRIRDYLRSAIYGGKGDDGLAQRLQLVVYPDIPAAWTNIDRPPDLVAVDAAHAVFPRLAALDPLSIGAHVSPGNTIPTLSFDDPAQEYFDQWRNWLETELRQADQHPALESHFAKYRKLIPALALLDHLIVGASGPICLPSMKRAVKWHQHLEKHAQRLYAAVTSAAADSAKALSQHIRRGALRDGFTVREVYRHSWSMLSNVKEATEAVEVLVDLGWLRPYNDKQPGTDGRATVRYLINPRVTAAV